MNLFLLSCFTSTLPNTHIFLKLLAPPSLLFCHLSNYPYKCLCQLYRYSFLLHVVCRSSTPLCKCHRLRSSKFHFHFANHGPTLLRIDLHLSSSRFLDPFSHLFPIIRSIWFYRRRQIDPFRASYRFSTHHHMSFRLCSLFCLCLTGCRICALHSRLSRLKALFLRLGLELE